MSFLNTQIQERLFFLPLNTFSLFPSQSILVYLGTLNKPKEESNAGEKIFLGQEARTTHQGL